MNTYPPDNCKCWNDPKFSRLNTYCEKCNREIAGLPQGTQQITPRAFALKYPSLDPLHLPAREKGAK